METTTQPWERQSGEPIKAYGAFRFYRDMAAKDRSLTSAMKAYYGTTDTPNLAQWKKWSARWNWQVRVAAWDDEQDRVARTARLQAIEEMNKRHVQAAQLLFSKAVQRLSKMEADRISPRVAMEYVDTSVRIERLVRGQPDTISQERVTTVNAHAQFDLNELTIEQLRALDRFAATFGNENEDTDGAGPQEPD